jgi:hypothetical protein
MTAKQALDKTIRKFERLMWKGEKPDWHATKCPLCNYDFGYLFCNKCLLGQFGSVGCYRIANELEIIDNSPEILQMLYQIRIYLYGWKGLWKER